jgi:hypothetical protein
VFTWFDLAWPWIGLCFAAVLTVLLATSLLRSDRTVARWRDLRWLSFLSVVVYLVHNIEEYGISATGVPHAFPDALCAALGQPPYSACGIPTSFYLVVNLPLIWVAAPVAAVLSNRFRLASLTLWGIIGVNAIVHIVAAVIPREYDPGLLTAVVLFLPVTAVAAVATIGTTGPYRRRAGAVLIGAGVIVHVVLAGSLILYLHGAIPQWLLLLVQPAVVIAAYVLVARLDRRLRGPV